MTLHQPMYNLDQQNFHELYMIWIIAGAFVILCVATLLVISKILREKSPSKNALKINTKLAKGILREIEKYDL